MTDSSIPTPDTEVAPPAMTSTAGLAAVLATLAVVFVLREEAAPLAAILLAGAWLRREQGVTQPKIASWWRIGTAVAVLLSFLLSARGAVTVVALIGAVDAEVPSLRGARS